MPTYALLSVSFIPRRCRRSEVRGIVARAEGNAFFTEELVAAAEMGGRSVPTDLADLLLVRLDQLDEAARQVVRAASVAGRRVPHELLAHVAGLDGSALDLALRAAVDGNVLISIRADSYGFRHALLAEAIYDDLLPGERVRLHGAYARALCDGDVVGTAAELARHARAAHMVETAVTASIQAGDEAMAVGGPDEAARHYEVALELLAGPDAQDGDGVDVDVVALTVKASEAAFAAGHLIRALALVQERLDQLPADAPRRAARPAAACPGEHRAAQREQPRPARADHRGAAAGLRRAPQPAARQGAQRACPRQRRPPSRRRGSRVGGEGADPGHGARASPTSWPTRPRRWPSSTSGRPTPSGRAGRWRRASRRPGRGARWPPSCGASTTWAFCTTRSAGSRRPAPVFEAGADRARETGRPWAPYGVDSRAMAVARRLRGRRLGVGTASRRRVRGVAAAGGRGGPGSAPAWRSRPGAVTRPRSTGCRGCGPSGSATG